MADKRHGFCAMAAKSVEGWAERRFFAQSVFCKHRFEERFMLRAICRPAKLRVEPEDGRGAVAVVASPHNGESTMVRNGHKACPLIRLPRLDPARNRVRYGVA